MIMEKAREGSLSSFSSEFVVSRTVLYKWVNRFKEELFEKGILCEKRKGKRHYLYVKDIDEFISFFRDKGIYLLEE